MKSYSYLEQQVDERDEIRSLVLSSEEFACCMGFIQMFCSSLRSQKRAAQVGWRAWANCGAVTMFFCLLVSYMLGSMVLHSNKRVWKVGLDSFCLQNPGRRRILSEPISWSRVEGLLHALSWARAPGICALISNIKEDCYKAAPTSMLSHRGCQTNFPLLFRK